MEFTIYDSLTGKILRNVSCPEDQFEHQTIDGSIAEGTYECDKFYWEDGFHQIPAKPDGLYNFDYTTKLWKLDVDRVISSNKDKRNMLLQSSDWTQLSDVNLTSAEKTRWATYRQALRDMTEQDFMNGNFPIY